MDIPKIYEYFRTCQKISTDSRKIEAGDMYCALKGDRFDGNVYAESAIEKGAKYAIIDDANYQKDDRYILVENALECLQDLATHHRKEMGLSVIAITGSNGKTTTKELVYSVLSTTYKTQATLGNLNNHIGVPLTLLAIKDETEIAVVEMGANHPIEINQLCKIALPNGGLITNIGKAHLEGFGSLKGVQKAKGELFDFLDHSGGKLFVNANDELVTEIAYHSMGARSYGNHKFCKTHVESLGANPFLKVRWFRKPNRKTKEEFPPLDIQTQLIGAYNQDNITAAIAVGAFFKVPAEMIKKGIEDYLPVNNRSQIVEKEGHTIILDAYNANPFSVKAAIENLAAMEAKDKIAILGDMLELGEVSKEEHATILKQLAAIPLKDAFLVGPQYAILKDQFPNFHYYEKVEDLKAVLNWSDYKEALFLIKGSRGIALEKILA